ncbi:MAG: hypothetical protein ACQ5SW_08620 [Sphaerochaetaceae bacterium]
METRIYLVKELAVRKAILLLVFMGVLTSGTLYASSPSYHSGVSTSVGFFSWYSQMDAGFKIDLSKTVALGLSQRVSYGYAYGEVVGMTELRTYLHQDFFFHIGISYLLYPSPDMQPDFTTKFLPYLGIGWYIPLDSNRRFYVVPQVEMNQSFYLTDDVRPIYSDLPFIIAVQIALAFEYRTGW